MIQLMSRLYFQMKIKAAQTAALLSLMIQLMSLPKPRIKEMRTRFLQLVNINNRNKIRERSSLKIRISPMRITILISFLILRAMKTMMTKMKINKNRMIMTMSRIPIKFLQAKQTMSLLAKKENSRRMIIHQVIKMTMFKSLMIKDKEDEFFK